ncbi:hypothetical protein QBC44DRAFT_306358 [Cladorrhinum sp. PSN332]|nr:hypothetical protein QBC44DRAFT_306358 [Cladorrhinum sp. PSN332]
MNPAKYRGATRQSRCQPNFTNNAQACHETTSNKGTSTVMPCASCGRFGHKLHQCIKATNQGDVLGCPICNVLEHKIVNCPTEPTDEKVWSWIGPGRARKPPFRVKGYSWQQLGFTFRHSDSGIFPWSVKFARQWTQANPDAWKTFNYGVDDDTLPADPDTEHWGAVARDHTHRRALHERKKRRDVAKRQRKLAKTQAKNKKN